MEIKKIYTQNVPAFRFIGRKYDQSDSVGGSFAAKWDECFAEGLFDTIGKQIGDGMGRLGDDSDAYIGLMRYKKGEPFIYAIGMFAPAGTPVPRGLEHYDFPASRFGIGWVYGNAEEGEVYCNECKVNKLLAENGIESVTDEAGFVWSFERYACPRFTQHDEKGNVILDVGFFVK